ncbi:MAG: Rrf2 family transcriptional regulator [Hyphomicrobiales bacterium]
MRLDNRLPRVLHALLHIEQAEHAITSTTMGKMLNMEASQVRRTMAGLRRVGIVGSNKGHGGGWYLIKPLDEISLSQVYQALGSPTLFALGQTVDSRGCMLERAANQATQKALLAAQEVFDAQLQNVSVADLIDFNAVNKIRPHNLTD